MLLMMIDEQNKNILDLTESVNSLRQQLALTVSSLEHSLIKLNDKSIESQVNLAESNNRHSQAMVLLTQIMAIAALVQALSSYAQWQVSEASVEVQRNANGIVQANIDYERMRDDRLEMREVDWRRYDIEHNR